jgi:hypothetical protein
VNILERLAAAQDAVYATYGTPAGSVVVVAIRFGLPRATVAAMQVNAMWRAVVADRERKRRIKLGVGDEAVPEAVALEPSRRMIAEGIRFARCPAEDMSKGALSLRNAAWEAGWTVVATRWVGLVPRRKSKGDAWEWDRERRVALHLERADGRRAVAHWVNGAWDSGYVWSPGEFRKPIGNRLLAAEVKATDWHGNL